MCFYTGMECPRKLSEYRRQKKHRHSQPETSVLALKNLPKRNKMCFGYLLCNVFYAKETSSFLSPQCPRTQLPELTTDSLAESVSRLKRRGESERSRSSCTS